MELNNRFVPAEERILHKAHLIPCRDAVFHLPLLCSVIRRRGNVIPSSFEPVTGNALDESLVVKRQHERSKRVARVGRELSVPNPARFDVLEGIHRLEIQELNSDTVLKPSIFSMEDGTSKPSAASHFATPKRAPVLGGTLHFPVDSDFRPR